MERPPDRQRARFWGGIFLVGIALLIAVSEVAIHMHAKATERSYDISNVDLAIALVIGFAGMYTLSPKGAKDGGQFIVDNTLKIISVIRFGRRRGDPSIAVLEDSQGNTSTIDLPAPTVTGESPTSDTPSRRKSDGP